LIVALIISGLGEVSGQTISFSGAMLCENGDVKTFGRNEDCQLGIGSSGGSYNSPQNTGITDAVAVATGGEHKLALFG